MIAQRSSPHPPVAHRLNDGNEVLKVPHNPTHNGKPCLKIAIDSRASRKTASCCRFSHGCHGQRLPVRGAVMVDDCYESWDCTRQALGFQQRQILVPALGRIGPATSDLHGLEPPRYETRAASCPWHPRKKESLALRELRGAGVPHASLIHNILCSRDGRTTSLPKPGGEPKVSSFGCSNVASLVAICCVPMGHVYCTREALTLAQSASKRPNAFPCLPFGLV